MSNINDYLDWRGDLSFDVSPLNEVDGMILSRISYLPFTEIKMKEQDTIENVMKKIVEVDEKEFNIEGDVLLAQKLLKSKRFNKIILSDFVIDNDEDAEKKECSDIIAGWLLDEYKKESLHFLLWHR